MGIESSRTEKLDYSQINASEYRNSKIRGWNSGTKEKWEVNLQDKSTTTMNIDTLKNAGVSINTFLGTTCKNSLSILEIGSGNRYATKIVTREFESYIDMIITTDICNITSDFPDIKFDPVHSVDAVKKYGNHSNTLLLISPYPSLPEDQLSLGDYYACEDFISLSKGEKKMIIFIGELGASDGTSGMYIYFMDHPQLHLSLRDMVFCGIDIFGGNVEKEVFIFDIQ